MTFVACNHTQVVEIWEAACLPACSESLLRGWPFRLVHLGELGLLLKDLLTLANLIYFEVITFIFFPMLVGELSRIRLQSSWVWNAKMNNFVLKVPVVAFLEVSMCLCLEVFIAYAADVGWIGSSEPFLSQVFGTRSTGLAIRGSSIGRYLKIKTCRVLGHYACHISLR